jgi:hypothetical protein
MWMWPGSREGFPCGLDIIWRLRGKFGGSRRVGCCVRVVGRCPDGVCIGCGVRPGIG